MSKVFLLSLLLWCVAPAQSRANDALIDLATWQTAAQISALDGGIDWKVGDRSNYKISSAVISGKSEQFVREDTAEGLWMNVNVDMGFLGTQRMEMLIDKSNGQIKKLLVNGREQTPPNPADLDVIDTHADHIRVIAGEFDCVYAKQKNRNDGKVQEGWSNAKLVPMGGMLRAIGESQIGKVTQELVSFSFAPRN